MSFDIPEKSDGAGIGSALTKKIGPLPGYAYVMAFVGIYAVYYIWQKKTAAPASAVMPETMSMDPSSIGGAASAGIIQTPNGTPPVTTNAQWARVAAMELVNSGDDPLSVDAALSDYLNGKALSPTEQQIVAKALQLIGQPPEGVIAPVITPTPMPTLPAPSAPTMPHPAPAPPATQPAPAPAPRTYVVQHGDTLWGIASRLYANPLKWTTIYNANKGLIDSTAAQHGQPGGGHWIYPGESLIIP